MRKQARETAFKIIYKSYFVGGDLSFEEILEEEKITPEFDKDYGEDKKFIEDLIGLYSANTKLIEQKINACLIGFSPERVFKIDRAILSLAIAELLFYKQTPYKIVVNEAVQMAKKYSNEKSYSFVNGVLKTIIGEMDGI